MTPAQPSPAETVRALSRYPHHCLAFVPNAGQWRDACRFYAWRAGLGVEIEADAIVCRVQGPPSTWAKAPEVELALRFEQLEATRQPSQPRVVGVDPLPTRYSFFQGADSRRWRAGLPSFREARIESIQPDVDVRVLGEPTGVRYDLLLAPGADLGAVVVHCSGHEGLELLPDGSLAIKTRAGVVRQTPPRAWYRRGGAEILPVRCVFRPIDQSRFGFALEGPRQDLALVVDPGLDFAVYVGGSGTEIANEVKEATDGSLVVVGETSADFPVTQRAFQPAPRGGGDCFVARMDARAHTLLWATYLGGMLEDEAKRVAVDTSGDVIVAGNTFSPDFPTTPGAFDRTHGSSGPYYLADVFVARLRADGTALAYSTFVGGVSPDVVGSLALSPRGEAIIAGGTNSADFPVTPGAFDTTKNGLGSDGFVTVLDVTGSRLVASTFLGGTNEDAVRAVSQDASGNIIVGGETVSPDFPTTGGAFQTRLGGGYDAFMTVLDINLSRLVSSTLFGGSADEFGNCFGIDRWGRVTIFGETRSTDLPGAQGSLLGQYDNYLAQLDAGGSRLSFCRYINIPPPADAGAALGVAVDPSGILTFVGGAPAGFPTTPGAWLRSPINPFAGPLVLRMGANGVIWYCSWFGGNSAGGPRAVSLTQDGAAVMAGITASTDLATPGVFDTVLDGMSDGFVGRMDFLPTGVTRYGASTPACLGPVRVDVTEMPVAGAGSFAVACSAAPPAAAGWLLLGADQDPVGTIVEGVRLHLALSGFITAIPAAADAYGFVQIGLPIPATALGARFFGQFLWVNHAGCTGPSVLSSSHALAITVN